MLTEYNLASHLIWSVFYAMMAVLAVIVLVELGEATYRTLRRWIRRLRGDPRVEDEPLNWDDIPPTWQRDRPESAVRRHFFRRFRTRAVTWTWTGSRVVGQAPPREELRIRDGH